ncbi:probable ATP-dependent RNA helicase DDX60 isoform X2 [Dendronephthya gigantea]|uniref:probable ATP-dependent RNA helicase DDX60 isoform X2 n=1 Tax=Dendronephthya gigantea TaxID=151771 RepID=UPI00106BA542|nr:probable ATP-dependent RNA helicase DDX60 isoform X2 [Dendronephthya gigantea]
MSMSSSSSEEDYDDYDERIRDLEIFIKELQPKMLNLMNEFADAEMFLIDGDSLLMELALEKDLDWTYSGQILHLVYLFERYLHFFVRKDGIFQIIFFKNLESVWKSQPCVYLARKIILQHLLANVSFKVLFDFESPWDPNFFSYIKKYSPSFMLLSDGEILHEPERQRLIPENALRIFVLHFLKVLSLEMNCAFTYGIEFGTSTLNGFHIMHSQRFRKWKLPTPDGSGVTRAFVSSSSLTQDINRAVVKLKSVSSMFNTECQDEVGAIDCRLLLHSVTAAVYLKLFSKGPGNQDFHHDIIRVLFIHGVILTQVSLKYRSFSLDDFKRVFKNTTVESRLKESLEKLQFIMAEVLDVFIQALKDEDSPRSMKGVCDAWDGRLFYQVLLLLVTSKANGSDLQLSDISNRKYESLVKVASSLLDDEEKLEAFPIIHCLEKHLADSTQVKNVDFKHGVLEITKKWRNVKESKDGLIKMECLLLNEYAGKILENTSVRKLDIKDPDVAALVVSGNNFDEKYHWHSGRPLTDEYKRTEESNNINQDKHARFMQRYGQSLHGEVTYKPIVVKDTTIKSHKKTSKISQKALAIQQDNSQTIEEKELRKEENSWTSERKKVQQYENEGELDIALEKLDRFLKGVNKRKIKIDVQLTRARILWKMWKDYCHTNKEDDRDGSRAESLFLTVQDLVENYKEDLSKKNKDTLGEYLDAIGFKNIVVKTNLTTKKFEANDEYSLRTSSSRFQLHNLGDQLKRESRTDRDNRIDHFIPETWQRKMLDAVDNKQSALIVAPTSSGKTFASFYCIEQVLKEDNDGVVVYVSPTKALVNQVSATCCVRYKKKMPPGKSVYGVFTRDFRQNALTCQILVTVPQCLEILLLSPARQDWVEKIRYVVFDEVHCIGSEIGAEVWEHLLLMIRCPFLALSATIRNPDDLHSWLQNAENDKHYRDTRNNTIRPNAPKSYKVDLITYNERYNDLEKFNYLPGRSKPMIEHIHPCSVITSRQLKHSGTFPAHVSLSPRETLAFYDAFQRVFNEEDSLLRLTPESHFQDETFITKQSVRSYENALKDEFMSYVNNNDKRVEKVIDSLSPSRTIDWSGSKILKRDALASQIFPLVEELKEKDQLPVIVFSFDRNLCERFAERLIHRLQAKEEELRKGKAKDKEKQEQKKAKLEKRQRDREEEVEVMRKTESSGHDSFHRQKKTTAETACFLFDNAPPKSCSYAGIGVLDDQDAQVIVERLEKPKGIISVDEVFKEGLRRGISYHHAGMPGKQRGVVEMLFRKKFLRVVFATGTLALGIHMPCKTAVFADDSVFLNTLQYHQISGRAGRRGYDRIGHVLFFGIPQAKIQRLMTVSLPRIIGNFPLNVSLVLRLLLLVNNVKEREIAMSQVLALLQNPLICKNQPELDLQLKHHFLFSVELLVRQGLLDEKGHPQGLAGLATHLHYHEPSNFILVTFLRDGLFHDICRSARSRDGTFSKDFLKSLVVLLSHLFARRKLHKIVLRRNRSTSKVLLEDLPAKFKIGLQKYNKKVRDVFDLYLRTVAGHVYDTLGEDVTLPLSRTKLISSESYVVPSPAVTLEDKLKSIAIPYKACSAFAALSGNSDTKLYSSQDLLSNIRYQVYTDVKVIPTLEDNVDLNAYAYDFFNHGNQKALVNENGLMQGDAYNLVKDFMLVLKSISVSLTELAPDKEDDDVIQAFTQLAEEYESTFNEAFKR